MANECKLRGYNGMDKYIEYFILIHNLYGFPKYPNWWHDERVYIGMRSRLLFKGRIDAVCAAIKQKLKVRSINDWLVKNNYPLKNLLKLGHVLELEQYCQLNAIVIGSNHYKQFNWAERDDNAIGYFWPKSDKA